MVDDSAQEVEDSDDVGPSVTTKCLVLVLWLSLGTIPSVMTKCLGFVCRSVVALMSEEVVRVCGLHKHRFKGKFKSAFDRLVPIKGVVYWQYVFGGHEMVVRVSSRLRRPVHGFSSPTFGDNGLGLDHWIEKSVLSFVRRFNTGIESIRDCNEFSRNLANSWLRIASQTGSGGVRGGRVAPDSNKKTDGWTANTCSRRQAQESQGSDINQANTEIVNTIKDQSDANESPEAVSSDVAYVEVEEEMSEELIANVERLLDPEEDIETNNESKTTNFYTIEKYFDREDRQSFLKAFPPIPDLDSETQQRLTDILWEYRDVMSEVDYDVCVTEAFEQSIKTTDDFESRFRKQGKRYYKPEEKRFMEVWVRIMKSRGDPYGSEDLQSNQVLIKEEVIF